MLACQVLLRSILVHAPHASSSWLSLSSIVSCVGCSEHWKQKPGSSCGTECLPLSRPSHHSQAQCLFPGLAAPCLDPVRAQVFENQQLPGCWHEWPSDPSNRRSRHGGPAPAWEHCRRCPVVASPGLSLPETPLVILADS